MQNKYDTNVTLGDNSSLTYIVKNINPGTTVLEFGPATGYMTKYLKEEAGCHVYIVEIDKDAFEKAILYAENGICGNAEDYEWYDKFYDIQFDYITFSDVLEHLVNPWKTLKFAANLLKKDTGRVLISIPNIGHNAVLIDLFNDKFKYRETGIMDNTHLRFFTHDSMIEMFHKCGLYIVNEDAVIFNLEYAGFGNSKEDVSENVWNELLLRKYGFVNQFLFTLSNNKETVEAQKKPKPSYELALYYTKDTEYYEEQKILGDVYIDNGLFYAEILFGKKLEIKQMMINLFPFSGVLYDMKIESDIQIESIRPINGMIDEGAYCFWGNEIKVLLEYTSIQYPKYVRVCGKLRTVQTKQLGKVIMRMENEQNRKVVQEELEIQRLNHVIEDKLLIIHELGQTIADKEKRLEEKEQSLREQTKFLEEMNEQIEAQEKALQEKEGILKKRTEDLKSCSKLLEEKSLVVETQAKVLAEKEALTTKLIFERKKMQEDYEQERKKQSDLLEQKIMQIEAQGKKLEENETFIARIKATKWFRIFGKRILMDK